MNPEDILYLERTEKLRIVLDHSVELDPDRAASVRVLLNVGELGLAIENLCENLDEFDIPVSASDREIINALTAGSPFEKYARYLDDNPLRPPEP
jgi:hypothetical protein